jgi:Tol biopolymer transport system component
VLPSDKEQIMSRAGVFLTASILAAALATASVAGKGGGKKPGGGSPADPAIAYVNGGDLAVVDEDGANATVLVENMGAGRPSWSPDGTQIAFGAYWDDSRTAGIDVQGVYVVNADGTGLREVIEHNDLNPVAVAWSPKPAADGKYKLAFTDWNPIAGVGGNTDLYIVNLDGTGLVNLTGSVFTGRTYEFWPTWSPDADRIAVFQSGPSIDTDVVIHDLGIVDGEVAITDSLNLTSDDDVPDGTLNDVDLTGCVPSWAKTQGLIAVVASSDIWVIDLSDPANPENVTSTPNDEERFPSFAPDDGEIAYYSSRGVYAIDGNGSTRRVVRRGGPPLDWRRNP